MLTDSQEVEELQNGENNQVVFAQYSRESAVVTHSSDYWTKRDNAKSRNRIEKMKSRTRESIVQNTMRLMTTTASDIVGPSEEVVLENEAGNDESEGMNLT